MATASKAANIKITVQSKHLRYQHHEEYEFKDRSEEDRNKDANAVSGGRGGI